MKKVKSWILIIMLLSATFTGFIPVQNREKELNGLTPSSYISCEPCFEAFLKNLSKLDALIYVPDTKLENAEKHGLVSGVKKEMYLDSIPLMSKYTQVTPAISATDACSQTVKATFDEMKMVVFVESSKSLQFSKMGLSKIEWKDTQRLKIDGEIHKNTAVNFKLVNNNNISVSYTPVVIKF